MGIVTLVFVFMLNGMTYEAEIDFLSMEDCLRAGEQMHSSDMEMMPAGCFRDAAYRKQVKGERI